MAELPGTVPIRPSGLYEEATGENTVPAKTGKENPQPDPPPSDEEETMTDFFTSHTTLVGIPYLNSEFKLWFRLIWGMFCLLFISLTLYQTWMQLQKYLGDNLSVETTREYPSSIHFPDITICSLPNIKLNGFVPLSNAHCYHQIVGPIKARNSKLRNDLAYFLTAVTNANNGTIDEKVLKELENLPQTFQEIFSIITELECKHNLMVKQPATCIAARQKLALIGKRLLMFPQISEILQHPKLADIGKSALNIGATTTLSGKALFNPEFEFLKRRVTHLMDENLLQKLMTRYQKQDEFILSCFEPNGAPCKKIEEVKTAVGTCFKISSGMIHRPGPGNCYATRA